MVLAGVAIAGVASDVPGADSSLSFGTNEGSSVFKPEPDISGLGLRGSGVRGGRGGRKSTPWV